jgi:uncharacterized membrane-anchored protein YhcB (DUF1043 family)
MIYLYVVIAFVVGVIVGALGVSIVSVGKMDDLRNQGNSNAR